jgi:hypothetical protein
VTGAAASHAAAANYAPFVFHVVIIRFWPALLLRRYCVLGSATAERDHRKHASDKMAGWIDRARFNGNVGFGRRTTGSGMLRVATAAAADARTAASKSADSLDCQSGPATFDVCR